MSYIVGLTGGIASGKSTVTKQLKKLNIPVVDADVIAREVVQPKSKGLNALVKTFGQDILTAKGELDRKALGEIVFNDEAKRNRLNSILHPLIRERILEVKAEYEAEGHPVIVLDIPLLFETDYEKHCDEIMVVSVPREIQIDRLMKRDQSSKEEALSRINAQMPLAEKVAKADTVIDNSGTLEETNQQVITWHQQLSYQ